MSDKSVLHYDDSKDRERLYNKSLDIIDNKAGNNIGVLVRLWVNLQYIFTKDQPSINQLKKKLKDVLFSNDD